MTDKNQILNAMQQTLDEIQELLHKSDNKLQKDLASSLSGKFAQNAGNVGADKVADSYKNYNRSGVSGATKMAAGALDAAKGAATSTSGGSEKVANQINAQGAAKKSDDLNKDGAMEGQEMEGQEGMEGAEGQEGMEGAPEGQEGMEGAEGAPEGQEGAAGDDSMAQLAQQVGDLDDEELDHLLQALMAEKESRHAQAGAEGGAPEQGAPEAQPQPAEKSMKKEFANLAKSISDIAGAVTKLSGEVASLKAQKPAQKVSTKPAAANAANAQVLTKSAPVKKRLAKSQMMVFLENEVRKGNRSVDRNVIAEAHRLNTEEAVAQFQDRMELIGIKFPETK